MTDKEKIAALAYDLGTLNYVTKTYLYISNIRLKFDVDEEVVQVSKRRKGNNQWVDV